MRNPMIGFRPTDKIQEHIDSELKKDPKKSKSRIIIELCEQGLSYSGQGGIPPTGILIDCPLRKIPAPHHSEWLEDDEIYYWQPPVDSSVCKTCHKYPCDSWEWIFSHRRLNPNDPSVKQLEKAHPDIKTRKE